MRYRDFVLSPYGVIKIKSFSYTLLELLLVLTLTVLLVLAGSYGWRQHQSARQLASSAHQLLDFIVCQQWHAAWGNRRCRLTAITGERWHPCAV